MRQNTLKRLEKFNEAIDMIRSTSLLEKNKFLNDRLIVSPTQRYIEIVAEFIVDLANFVIAKSDKKIPDIYKETINVVSSIVDLGHETTLRLKELIGLRNIITHMYAEIDDEIIYESLPSIVKFSKNGVEKLIEYCKQQNIDP